MNKMIIGVGLLLVLAGCAWGPVPMSVNGMIVTRPDSTKMKIVWCDGEGNTYKFYEPVLVIGQKGDTATEWRLIRE